MIRNWYNQIPHPVLKTKREITKYINWQQFTKAIAVTRMNSSFSNRWSFSNLKFTKYVTNIIAEPKYKYGQQEQVTVRNHNRSTALERSVLKYLGGGGGGLNFKLCQQVFLIKQTWPQSGRMQSGLLILNLIFPFQNPSPHGKSTIRKPAGNRKTSHISPLGKRSTNAKWVLTKWVSSWENLCLPYANNKGSD